MPPPRQQLANHRQWANGAHKFRDYFVRVQHHEEPLEEEIQMIICQALAEFEQNNDTFPVRRSEAKLISEHLVDLPAASNQV